MIHTLKEHLKKYPRMQVQDVAKIIYQSEFGGGHMIADAEKSFNRIQQEYQVMQAEGWTYADVIEPIGDDMCRVYLNCLDNGVKAEVLNQMFVISANNKRGTVAGLEAKLEAFLSGCEDGTFPFSTVEVIEFIAKWKADGYPAMSHSDVYGENYKPAYRVVEMAFAKVYEVICGVEAHEKESYVIAIDGMCGSGKSTFGELLQKNYPEANLFRVDDYFLQPHQRTTERLAEAGGNVDYERFKEEIVDKLSDKNGLIYRPFSCQKWCLDDEITVPWKPLVIIEGAYSHHPYLGKYYDVGVFCELSAKEQEERICKRNGEEMWRRFRDEWIPMEKKYFETFKIKENSDIK